MGWFKSSCFKTDLLDVRRWRGRDNLYPGAGVRHEEHGHEPHRGRAPRDDQRVRHRRLRTGAQYTTHFSSVCPNNKYSLPTKLFLFDQIEFPEFCDMMASKMSDNDDEEAVRWEQLFSRKTFISLQLSTGTFALAFSHMFTSFQILAMISGESLVLFTAILLLLLIKYDLRSPPSSSGYKN